MDTVITEIVIRNYNWASKQMLLSPSLLEVAAMTVTGTEHEVATKVRCI